MSKSIEKHYAIASKIDAAIKEEIRDYFDCNPNVTFDQVAHIYGMSHGLTRAQVKAVLMSTI